MNKFQKRHDYIQSNIESCSEKCEKYLNLMKIEFENKKKGWKIRFKIYAFLAKIFVNSMGYWSVQQKKLNEDLSNNIIRLQKELQKKLAE